MSQRYRIVFLRPKGVTRFRIQDGFFTDTTLKYIPADTIYSLYFSKLLEIDKNFQKLNEKTNIDDIREKYVEGLPRITSAYPYFKRDNKIYFYLPLIYFESEEKKVRKKFRDYNFFVSLEVIKKILDKRAIEDDLKDDDYRNIAQINIDKITRNIINRKTSTTNIDGGLFAEEYVFCYRQNNNEFGYYFLIEDNPRTEEFLAKVREFFEIRGIGADKSTSNSIFEFDDKERISKEIMDYNKYVKELYDVIEKLKEEKYILHPLVLNKETAVDGGRIKIRFLVIDGKYVYPIISDGSKLGSSVKEPIVTKIKRRFKGRLSIRVFYGLPEV